MTDTVHAAAPATSRVSDAYRWAQLAIGAGGVYGTCVGNALKWFPDKRGLAAGITAAGFGAGSALTVAPIQAMIKDSGFQSTFLYFGLGQGIIIVILAFFLFAPKPGQVPAVVQNANLMQSRRNYNPTEVVRHPIFWLMYFMFVIVGAGGLMVTANLKPIAVDWKVDSIPVTLIGMTMTAVTFAATRSEEHTSELQSHSDLVCRLLLEKKK